MSSHIMSPTTELHAGSAAAPACPSSLARTHDMHAPTATPKKASQLPKWAETHDLQKISIHKAVAAASCCPCSCAGDSKLGWWRPHPCKLGSASQKLPGCAVLATEQPQSSVPAVVLERSLAEVLGGGAAGRWAAQGPHTASAAQQLVDVAYALQAHRGQPGLQLAGVGLLVHLVQGLWGSPWGLQVCDVGHVPRAEGCTARGTCVISCVFGTCTRQHSSGC